jgi:hypothetical protein
MLQSGLLGPIFGFAVGVIAWSALLFPVAAFAVSVLEGPRVRLSWMAPLCSVAMSLTQFLAMLPLVQ